MDTKAYFIQTSMHTRAQTSANHQYGKGFALRARDLSDAGGV